MPSLAHFLICRFGFAYREFKRVIQPRNLVLRLEDGRQSAVDVYDSKLNFRRELVPAYNARYEAGFKI